MSEDPPGRLRRKVNEEGISTGQAAALLRQEYGVECSDLEVARVLRETGAEKYWTHWFVLPEQLPMLAGGVRQRLALWWQKRLVRGEQMCAVAGVVDGKEVLMSLPLERVYRKGLSDPEVRLYERIDCYEWPTGTRTGRLDLDPDQEQDEATARYIYTRA